jgi:hypothetical protein
MNLVFSYPVSEVIQSIGWSIWFYWSTGYMFGFLGGVFTTLVVGFICYTLYNVERIDVDSIVKSIETYLQEISDTILFVAIAFYHSFL